MPSPLLFIRATPLPLRRTGLHTAACTRKPRLRVLANASPDGPTRDPGDPSWMDLARSLGASDSEPTRPPPQWKLPDEDEAPAEGTEAWAAWNAAVQRHDSVPDEPRDPRKETDFWRAAARDLSAPASEDGSDDSSTATGPQAENPATDPTATSTDIWRLARGVTGEMSDLQERLRADLERYNPEENRDQYRDIARELVGPPSDEPWADTAPVRSSDSDAVRDGPQTAPDSPEAEPGSGWNPDVDWMRFEDLRREQALKADADARSAAARQAQEKRSEAYDRLEKGEVGTDPASGQEGVTYTDEHGRELSPDEVKKAMQEGAVFVDEAGAEIDAAKADQIGAKVGGDTAFVGSVDQAESPSPSGKAPAFITNRFKLRGTYGAGWSGAENEIKSLQEKGIPLRDPKADAEAWRSAARELNIDVGSEVVDAEPTSETGIETRSPAETKVFTDSNVGETVAEGSNATRNWGSHESSTSGNVEDVSPPTADAHASWSMWREGLENWEKAAEVAPPRDPKKEVDMWRASARELTSENEGPSATKTEADIASSPSNTNAWDNWRDANAKWESSVAEASDSSDEGASSNTWATQDQKTDWGSGLGGKASSDRSAWENWNNVKGEGFSGGDSSLWWSSRSDSASRASSGVEKPTGNNTDQWRAAAREVSGLESSSQEGTGADSADLQAQNKEKDMILDFWKEAAKDMPVGESTDRIDTSDTMQGE